MFGLDAGDRRAAQAGHRRGRGMRPPPDASSSPPAIWRSPARTPVSASPASTTGCSARRRWSRSGAVSRKHALEMALTGRLYSAAEAERFGLVNRVVAEGRALEEARALAKKHRGAFRLDAGDRQAHVLRPDRRAARRGLPDRGPGDGRQPRPSRQRRGLKRLPRKTPAPLERVRRASYGRPRGRRGAGRSESRTLGLKSRIRGRFP